MCTERSVIALPTRPLATSSNIAMLWENLGHNSPGHNPPRTQPPFSPSRIATPNDYTKLGSININEI